MLEKAEKRQKKGRKNRKLQQNQKLWNFWKKVLTYRNHFAILSLVAREKIKNPKEMRSCGSVGTGRRARLRILWALRSCGFKSHLPHDFKSELWIAALFLAIQLYKRRANALQYLCPFYIQYKNFGHLQFVSDDKPNVFWIFFEKRGICDFM